MTPWSYISAMDLPTVLYIYYVHTYMYTCVKLQLPVGPTDDPGLLVTPTYGYVMCILYQCSHYSSFYSIFTLINTRESGRNIGKDSNLFFSSWYSSEKYPNSCQKQWSENVVTYI